VKKGWDSKRLGDVLLSTETAAPHKQPNTAFEYIDVSSICNTAFEVTETQSLIGKDAPSRARRRVRTDDVLFATIRPTLKRIAVIPPALDNVICSTGFIVLRASADLLPRLLFYYLQTNEFVSSMERLQKGTSYPAVTDNDVRGQLIPLPPIPEQRRIVAILDEALEGIAAAKANAEKNLRNAKEVFEAQLTLMFTQDCQHWPERRLFEVCREITVGHVGSMKGEYRENGIPFLRSQNIRPFEVTLENVVYVNQTFHRSLKKSMLKPGDLAIVRTGYPGTTAVIPESLPEANCSDLVIMRVGNELEPSYVAAFLNSSYGRHLVGSQLVGAAQKHFNVTAAKQVPLRIPPRAVQTTVVAVVMRLRDQVRSCEAVLRRKDAALDELKASLLHQAFTGQL
jgi:type I restriction enzyme S subunit